jgi:murein L,D-transpeptidase YcbB/YkuD
MLSRWTLTCLLLSAAPVAVHAAQPAGTPGAATSAPVTTAPAQPPLPKASGTQPGAPAAAIPMPLPAPVVIQAQWDRQDAADLLDFVDRIDAEGLDARDYRTDSLRQALAASSAGQGVDFSPLATTLFLKVASDLMFGHSPAEARVDWHMADDPFRAADQQALLDRATGSHAVADTLRSLLPTHPQYAALKALLATSEDEALKSKIRVNLDRWRWLPRDLGTKYVIVNVPAYTVALVESGTTLNRRRAVAGALKTPTPQLSAVITGAIFNPWWEVPSSISKEVSGKKGYVSVPTGEGGVRWRQPPGPRNALGRVKLVMGNPYAIYLHDTNAKHLFDTKARAYSHGCIRTEDAVGFAQTLLDGTDWDRGKIDKVLASGKSSQANLAAPVPVYIAYFTVAATSDGPGYMSYKDIYSRDNPVLAALDKAPATTRMATAAR